MTKLGMSALLCALAVLAAILSAGCAPKEKAFDISQVECPEGYWVYDGRLFEQAAEPGQQRYLPYMLIRRHEEVYGYDFLTTSAQYAFDLFYGEYFSGNIRDEGAVDAGKTASAFFHFTMQEPLTKEEWNNAIALYEAATVSYSYRPFRYAGGDDTVGKVNCLGDKCPCKRPDLNYHVYAARTTFSDKDLNFAFDRLQEMARGILADMPPDVSDAEKCAYIAQYLTDHITYFTDHYWEKAFIGDFTVINSDASFITAYGALTDGQANCFGYARAFDYLAKRAGLTSIAVLAWNENDTVGHAWNCVMLDGKWYQIDVTWMDNETPEPDWQWFLFGGKEPEHDYFNVQTYARYTIPLPKCADTPYPAFSRTPV